MSTVFNTTICIAIYIYLFAQSSCNIALNSSCRHHPNQSLPVPLTMHQISYYNVTDTIYLFGGVNGQTASNNIFKWNLSHHSDHTQTNIEKIDTTIISSTFYSIVNNAVTINEFVYFIGINDGNLVSGKIYKFNMETELFEDNDDFASVINPAFYGCLSTNNSHIFMVGGKGDDPNDPINILQVYDILNNYWISEEFKMSPIYQGWFDQFCVMIDNELFVIGGKVANTGYFNAVYKYHWSFGWKYIGNKPLWIGEGMAVYHNPYIYTIGGGWPITDAIIVYHPQQEITVNTYHLMEPLWRSASIIINDTLYVFGGSNNTENNAVSSIQICDLYPTSYPTAHPTLHPTPNSGKEEKSNNIGSNIIFLIVGIIIGIILSVLCFITYIYIKRRRFNISQTELINSTPRDRIM